VQVRPQTPHARAKSWVALILTFGAGMVDIIGYIAVYHFFVAHMTGTTVHFGNKLATRAWSDVAKSGITLLSFVGGSVIGRSIIEAGSRHKKRTVATITLLIEAGLIVIFIWLRPALMHGSDSQSAPLWVICALLSLLAIAMGLQTATLTRIGPLTIHTTFVTGMLNKFAQAISQWLFWMHDRRQEQAGLIEILLGSGADPGFRNARFMFAIWLSYMVGSVTGTWMHSRWNVSALYLPVLILVLSAGVDQVQPLSIEEEREQS
jgi:uncharacterized membrane protein YoaK (UPF0700 family)